MKATDTLLSKSGVMVSTAAVILFFKSGMLTGCGGTDTLSFTAVETITPDLLSRVWQELDYRLDVCRVTKGAYIELL